MMLRRLSSRACLLGRGRTQARDLNTGILREGGDEKRVSMVPSVAEKFIAKGYKIIVEEGAGQGSGVSDAAYAAVGCTVLPRAKVVAESELLFAVNPPPAADLGGMKGKMLVAWVGRRLPEGAAYVKAATTAGVTLVDTTSVPRITIAQKMDVLSSQAKCAGHRAVLEGAYAFERFYQGEITAAGKYPPCHTMVLGIGVAGLASMGTSSALGSVVRAWDVRDVSDQVTSMGGKWIKVDFKEDGAGAGGYAKESSPEFQQAQKDTFHKHAKECDIIISTAAIPGRKSPVLIEEYMVKDMKPGSVIVDLAAAGGGNCTLTRAGEKYVTDNGVTIIGYTDLAGRMGLQASAMYAQNMLNMSNHITGKAGAEGFMPAVNAALGDQEKGDIIVRSIVCCKDGEEVVAPPPPDPTPVKKKVVKEAKKVEAVDPAKEAMTTSLTITGGSAALLASSLGGDAGFLAMLNTFGLAGAAGYQVVWGVTHALHTPLMAVTNAISGLTAAGGLMCMGAGGGATAQGLAYASVLISSVNISGGFLVSKRMLDLFKKEGEKSYSVLMLTPALIFLVLSITRHELLGPVSVVSALLCVAAIGGLASFKTAEAGCKFGMLGVFGALVATMVPISGDNLCWAMGLMALGGAQGLVVGKKVSPIALPQTVAAFHSLVGFAATATSIGSFYADPKAGATMENIAALLGDFIGGVTLTGSIIAFGKLNGNLKSTPLNLPGKNLINLGGLCGFVALSVEFLQRGDGIFGVQLLLAVAVLACLMGVHLVGSVGGGDMPVCITVLNSYSGWALVAEGFLLNSTVLTIVGSLIGFSGGILTKIMCDAMNRDIFNVLFGGINNKPVAKAGDAGPKEHVETSVAAVAQMLVDAKEVLIVPGYGMAMARAQGSIGELANLCRSNKINVKFGIHPVAGRMPGQMNVLLAEAGVPHEWVLEMDEVNPDMESNDVVLVVGANDVVNSAAQEVEGCAIWGMPLIEVWRSKKVIFCKRSMGGGYADLDNPVFYKENTEMLLGDAKKTADSLAAKVRELLERV